MAAKKHKKTQAKGGPVPYNITFSVKLRILFIENTVHTLTFCPTVPTFYFLLLSLQIGAMLQSASKFLLRFPEYILGFLQDFG